MKLKSIITGIALLIFAASVYGYHGVYVQKWGTLGTDILYVVSPLFAFLCGLYSTKIYGLRNAHGRAVLFMTLGLLGWLVGEMIWVIFEQVLDIDPYPSLADFFYLSAYPFFFLGFLSEASRGRVEWNKSKQVMALFMLIILVTIVSYFGIFLAYDIEVSFLENIVAISYGIGDQILIILLIYILFLTLEFEGGLMYKPWLAITLGASSYLFADIFFAVFTTEYDLVGGYYVITDMAWITSYLLFGYGVFGLGTAIKSVEYQLETGQLK